MNLIYGGSWTMSDGLGGSQDIPARLLDARGWVKSLPPGYQVSRPLSVPAGGGEFVCRYRGRGRMSVHGAAARVSEKTGEIRFAIRTTYPHPQPTWITWPVDPDDYIRDVDCREAGAPKDLIIAPEFVRAAKGFKVIRFTAWQPATGFNWSTSWATRNKPGDGDYTKNDGVPIEYIMEAAREIGADPWVTIPWNADDDYITRLALYARAHLAPGHRIYVELSNEVWNETFQVFHQASDEARREGLSSAERFAAPGGAGERYAEKAQHVMQIWSTVFRGRAQQLVRVFAWQHVVPYRADKLLAYRSTYKYVDALATAPYWGHDAENWTTGQDLGAIMGSLLPGMASEAVDLGAKQKAVADKYGLRYVTYEGGQHIVLQRNLPMLSAIEFDPRMCGLYVNFVKAWAEKVGGTLTLFNLTGDVVAGGQWGMWHYAGEPLERAPKMQAVEYIIQHPNARAAAGGSTNGLATTACGQATSKR